MRIPLAKYGARELVLFGGLALAGLIVSAVLAWWPLALLFAATLAFIVAFFRDPERRVPADPGALVAPADGRVTEVTEAEEPRFLKARAH